MFSNIRRIIEILLYQIVLISNNANVRNIISQVHYELFTQDPITLIPFHLSYKIIGTHLLLISDQNPIVVILQGTKVFLATQYTRISLSNI